MIDNKFFFDKSVELGFTTTDYEPLVNLHTNGARVLQSLGCESVFEFGSGLGFFLSACQRVGLYNYMGYDINPYEREFAISKGVEPSKYMLAKWASKYQQGRYELRIKGKYDAIYSTEVFEHMTDEQISFVMPILYKACNKYFYFTSTPYASQDPAFDIEWGHINLKQKEQWVAVFHRHGFDLLRETTEVTPWGLLFVKREGKVRGMANFIKAALDKVFTEGNQFPSVTYETPEAVVKYMEMQSAVGNPPWEKRKGK